MKNYLSILFIILVCTFSCKRKENNDISQHIIIDTLDKLVPTDSNSLYFPDSLDNFRNQWYSKQLFAMREPIISKDTSRIEIYRFTWLRTFHNPISVRIERQSNCYLLSWKQCNGAGGYEPKDLIISQQKIIDQNIWYTFVSKIKNIEFWNLPSVVDFDGKDGAQWILEGKASNRYHFTDRWSDASKEYIDCCKFLLEQANLSIDTNKIY